MDHGGNLHEGLLSHPDIFNFIVWFIENFSSFDQIQSSLQILDSSPSLATRQTFFFQMIIKKIPINMPTDQPQGVSSSAGITSHNSWLCPLDS